MKLLSTQELAEETGVPERTLSQWAYMGRGPAYLKIGKHRRYRREDVDAWLEAQRRGGDVK
jgi:excisionase family DNA binding protein